MLEQVKTIARNSTRKWLGLHGNYHLTARDVQPARAYISNYWKKLERFNPKDNGSILGLPKPYLVPSQDAGAAFDFNEMYYWDSYFMVQGMLDKGHQELVMGILENMTSLFKRLGVIPNASKLYLASRSQPPFLTTFIFDVFNAYQPGLEWLKSNMEVAKEEYKTVWMGTAKPNARLVHKGLSRYYSTDLTHELAEAESGWDYTSRFEHRCLDYLPVDLNALLYKYEVDFAKAARLLDDSPEIMLWDKVAATRKAAMDELMWDSSRGIYCDYDYSHGRRGSVASLATFYPLWAGMVDERRAAAMVRSLKRFELKGGLLTTDSLPAISGSMPLQWAYPNGWAPLHFLVVKGLQRYGYNDAARRIAFKWLYTNLDWFVANGVFLEKYNVASPKSPPTPGVYATQTGFGWTNAVFERFCQEFIDGDIKA